jgi:outer membrane protein assembly factor BamA
MLPLSFQYLLSKFLPFRFVKKACLSLLLSVWAMGSVAQENPTTDCIASDIQVRIETGAFEKLNGKKIRNINYKQLNVFDESDPKENNRIYRFLNALHFTTRKSVVESQLLFKTGDIINHQTIDESARILRTRSYLTDAYIMPEAICGDQVDVLVVTRDSWALEPRVSYTRESNDNQTGFGINDGNIFGTGNSLTIGYSENQQRNAISYDFSNPHIFNKPVAVRLSFADTSDGRNTLVDVSHPFYALDTPWSAGGRLSDLSQIDTIRSRGIVVNEFRHRAVEHVGYFGLATDINNNFTQRWLVGFTHEEDSFYEIEETLSGIPARDKAVYPWIEYQYIENKFGVLKNVNQIQRLEDVAAGQKITVRVGMAGKTFGNPDDVVRYKIDYENFIEASDKHIFEVAAKLDGRQHLGISGLDPNILTSSVAYHYLQDDKNRWYARAEFGIGQNLPQYKEFTVGDITGLRGYPTDYLRGNKRYAFTLERRYFSDIYLFNLLRMGAVVFVDSGKAWGLPSETYSPLLTNVGVGLRFSSTKVRVGNVARIDIAVPTAAKSGLDKYQLTIGAYQKF